MIFEQYFIRRLKQRNIIAELRWSQEQIRADKYGNSVLFMRYAYKLIFLIVFM